MSEVQIVQTTLGGTTAEHVQLMLERGARESGQFTVMGRLEGETAFLAFDGAANRIENVVGALIYKVAEDEPPAFFLPLMYVLPSFRKQGIGRSIMTKAIRCAELVGCTDFAIHVKSSNLQMLCLLDAMSLEQRSFRFHLSIVPHATELP